jgi:aryl-alcohol dehydrogenase-like predicted oxidoreductase
MRYDTLGPTEIKVSRLGFGCARLGGFFGDTDRRQPIDLLRAALESGITFYDTSDMYTQGESERIIGQAFRQDRSRVVIATKTGFLLPARRRLAAGLKPVLRPVARRLGIGRSQVPQALRGSLSQDFTASRIRAAVEGSLRRLQTDYIDLYQLHSPTLDVISSGLFVRTLDALVVEGKIRCYGISCEEPAHVPAALKHPIAAVQVRVNLVAAGISEQATRLAAAAGVGVIARECFGGGALTKPESWVAGAVASRAVAPADAIIINRLRADAEREGVTLREQALRWVFGLPSVSVILLGMRDRSQLSGNLAAVDTLELAGRQ